MARTTAPCAEVHVAAGVLVAPDGQVLIQQRHRNSHQGGLWEFPGGKVEAGEHVVKALRRELLEELGVEVEQARPLIRIRHAYSDITVVLDVHFITGWSGQVSALEQQPLAWVSPHRLRDWAMPAADVPIVSAIQLPATYPFTPDFAHPEQALGAVSRIASEHQILRMRLPSWTYRQRLRLARALNEQFPHLQLMSDDLDVVAQLPGMGLHLTSHQLSTLEADDLPAAQWLAASVHSQLELELAEALGVQFLTLSPVLPTSSHPSAKPLGWDLFADLVSKVNLPVFALGGVQTADLPLAWSHGAQGISGISAFFAAS